MCILDQHVTDCKLAKLMVPALCVGSPNCTIFYSNSPSSGHPAITLLITVVSSHVILPSFRIDAFLIERVRVKFLVDTAVPPITKEFTVNPLGRFRSSFVSPRVTVSVSPVGRVTLRLRISLTSHMKVRGSVGHTPPAVHCESLKLADADGIAAAYGIHSVL